MQRHCTVSYRYKFWHVIAYIWNIFMFSVYMHISALYILFAPWSYSSHWLMFLAATKQLYEWFSPSVCLSVRLSVRHTFLTMFPSSYHHEIFRSYYQWQKWCPCKRSRLEVKGQGHRGHDPTSPFPDCNSSLNSHMMMKSCIRLDNT